MAGNEVTGFQAGITYTVTVTAPAGIDGTGVNLTDGNGNNLGVPIATLPPGGGTFTHTPDEDGGLTFVADVDGPGAVAGAWSVDIEVCAPPFPVEP